MSLSRLNIQSRLNGHFTPIQIKLLADILTDIQTDQTTIQASIASLATAIDTVGDGFNTAMTKLNADATAQNLLAAFPLTLDTNYATVSIDAAGDVTALTETGI